MGKFADEAMFKATPMDLNEEGAVEPKVTVISMTANPLRVMAAAAQLYSGDVVRDPNEIPRDMALRWLANMSNTKLQAPLEFIDIHLLLEGVTRALVNQLERQRTAVYIQESLRFSVRDEVDREIIMPPGIDSLPDEDSRKELWRQVVNDISVSYNELISQGIPAEDVRGILPLNTSTRVHYKTNLRNLADHAGLRLCSQAQYEWKVLWRKIIEAIVAYGPFSEGWQQRAIADLFKPVCYQTGKCEFKANIDRYCIIRERVENHHRNGEPPSEWTDIEQWEPIREGAARRSAAGS